MGLPRTFVGFSSTDIHCYHLMLAWKCNNHIDFNFTDCQLPQAVNSDDESYVKRCIRQRISMAGTYALLIGEDTKYQRKYVRWEAEVAIDKGCTIIGINLDGAHRKTDRCPRVLEDVGALFVPYSPTIVAYALERFSGKSSGNWGYDGALYSELGY
jgi:hypothetical protein